MDKKLKVYDIRTFKPLKSYFIPAGASCLSLSQRGLLSAATGDVVQVSINSTSIAFSFTGFMEWNKYGNCLFLGVQGCVEHSGD